MDKRASDAEIEKDCHRSGSLLDARQAALNEVQWSRRRLPEFVGCSLLLLLFCHPALAQRPQPLSAQHQDLTLMNIEDLMNIEVTSVSRTEEKLSRTASAVFVIGPEDIRDSGALNIPDILRMVPGVDVAQITSNTWAIAVRGFNSRFSNKVLVLLDGRAVYTPTFGGVFWDVLNLPLEDIERIEVIRGPGGSIWGANAVDGVIDIITKNAGKTHGGMVSSGGGSLAQGFGTVQYGGKLANKTDYRIYTQYKNEGQTPNGAGQEGGDGWHLLNGGFRTDNSLSASDTLMVQGAMYAGQENIPVTHLLAISSPGPQFTDAPANLSGGYIQSVWDHALSARSGTTLELSYDTYQRNDALREGRKTFIADFQHHVPWGDRQNILWGLALRYTSSHSDGNFFVSLNPPAASNHLFSSFVQDEITLMPDRLYLTVGTKVERSYYTGWAALPSARLAWVINARNTLWASYSRPIRTPNETDIALRSNIAKFSVPDGPPRVIAIMGSPNYGNEAMTAYEMGYRSTLSRKLSMDVAAYYNDYNHRQSVEPGTPFLESTSSSMYLVLPRVFGNLMYGEAHGFEISTKYKLSNRWSISPGYAFQEIHMHVGPASLDTTSVAIAEGSSPGHSAQLRSHVELFHGLEWSTSAYFVDRLASGNIPAYTRVDTQLTWNWRERGTFSVVGQNLLQDHHFEFRDFLHSVDANQAKRSVYAVIRWSF